MPRLHPVKAVTALYFTLLYFTELFYINLDIQRLPAMRTSFKVALAGHLAWVCEQLPQRNTERIGEREAPAREQQAEASFCKR